MRCAGHDVGDRVAVVFIVRSVTVEESIDPGDAIRMALHRLQAERPTEPLVIFGILGLGGDEALELSASTGLEGVVAKRRKSRYLPGKRSSDWVKVKPVLTRDVILCGWHPGEGNRSGRIGSLYCGAYLEPGGELVLIGKVGSGLDFAMLEVLGAELAALEVKDPPFDVSSVPPADRRAAHWLDPLLVAEVTYSGWAGDGARRDGARPGGGEHHPPQSSRDDSKFAF